MIHRFFVPGIPVPKGSARSYINRKTGKLATVQDNREKQKPWAATIGWRAQETGCKVTDGPVQLSLEFVMPRPKCHYGTGKNASTLKPQFESDRHTVKPDLDKLIRCVKDALTGIAWRDDCQVDRVAKLVKRYSDGPNDPCGVWILIEYAREVVA